MGKYVVIGLIGLAISALVLLIISAGIYNGLIKADERVNKEWAEIDNMLQRRADLIPNLVETVKGYATHEKEVFIAVADARSRLIGARSVSDKAEAAGELNSALSRLLAIAENYPQLKADTTFLKLQDELAGTENRIAVTRTRYHEAVQVFNAKIKKIPGVLFAGFMGLEKRPYFEIKDEKVRDVPKVSFE